MSTQANDEGFREIQLNGKQLVFLFMAATVVSVVIFLLGVLVGKDLRTERPAVQETASAEIAADPGTVPPPSAAAPAPAPLAAEPPSPADELTYAERLKRDSLSPENLKPAPAPPPEARAPRPPPAQTQPPASAANSAPAVNSAPNRTPQAPPAENASIAVSAPSGPGFAVQVSIFDNRREADTLAKQLIAKGYPAFVMDPVKGAPRPIYRVRVGKYKNRKDAEAISARLEKAEQFTPWIAR